MKVTVKVPATIANLGCGFDSFGLALPIYNTIIIEETVIPQSGVEIRVVDENNEDIKGIPTDKSNIIYKVIDLLYNSTGQTPDSLKITVKTGIPIAKGLGSSASVVVGSLIAANQILGEPADIPVLMSLAAEVEGHPDNIVPAFAGGFTVASVKEDGSVVYRKLSWPKEWKLTVCIPDYELSTDISRSVLPKEILRKDAVFNLSRTALFIEAIHLKDGELLKYALQDKLHQPYREKLVPGLVNLMSELKHTQGVLGCVLAGAGPSSLIISENANQSEIKEIIENSFGEVNGKSLILSIPVEENGAVKI